MQWFLLTKGKMKMKNKLHVIFLMLAFSMPILALADSPYLVGSDGKYLGNLSANKYDPNSVNNPYGRYGSKYSTDSVNNKYGKYGSKYSNSSARNPYANNAPKIYHGQH